MQRPGQNAFTTAEAAAQLDHRGRIRREYRPLSGSVRDGAGGDALGGGLSAEHADVAGGGSGEVQHHVDGGGLAGAVRAEEAVDFAVSDRQGQVLDGGDVAVALGEAVYLDDHGSPWRVVGWGLFMAGCRPST